MESLANGAKRKKRKTRKCLDEIRKRSRRTGQVLFENDCRFDEMYPKNTQKCMLTTDRLTLRMFPKVIQSRTITRPALLNTERKTMLNLEKLVKDNVLNVQAIDRVSSPTSNVDSANSYESFQNRSNNSDDVENEQIVLNSMDKENFDMFSSMDELHNESPDSIGTASVSTATSSSTQSLHEDNGYNLYEEFMSEVPACLQQNSKLIQEDVMKKTKMLLQNLFIESCYDECEDNILKCIRNDKSRSMYYEVLHDPAEYLRRARASPSPPGSSPCPSASRSACPSASPSPSPGAGGGSSAEDARVCVSPDYVYYPHRLN